MVLIIIKGVFRRYESWNPIHPTTRAFWGYGLGIRCGVGWGPGFGPEVIGYVGADCGIRFSVGITLAGIGISFPANFLLESPYKAFNGDNWAPQIKYSSCHEEYDNGLLESNSTTYFWFSKRYV